MNCSWPMYRQPYGQSFRYTCGLYQQSHGEQCDHKHVDGPLAARFVLACLRQRLLSPALLPKLKRRLRDLAAENRPQSRSQEMTTGTQIALDKVRGEIKLAKQNLALASNPDSFRAIETVFAELKQREAALDVELNSSESRSNTSANPDEEIEAALAFAERLSELAADGENFALAKEAFAVADAKLFVRFKPVCKKQRTVNQISGGVVTLGAAAPPIDIYNGPTNRNKVKETSPQAAKAAQGACERRSPTASEVQDSDREETSLGNVSRDDRTPIELFINGLLLYLPDGTATTRMPR
jgi:hypothetical protein